MAKGNEDKIKKERQINERREAFFRGETREEKKYWDVLIFLHDVYSKEINFNSPIQRR